MPTWLNPLPQLRKQIFLIYMTFKISDYSSNQVTYANANTLTNWCCTNTHIHIIIVEMLYSECPLKCDTIKSDMLSFPAAHYTPGGSVYPNNPLIGGP